jgi:hypothetical protein
MAGSASRATTLSTDISSVVISKRFMFLLPMPACLF